MIPPPSASPLIKATVYTHLPRFAPPAPQLWGEIGTFRGFKSPRIGGFRGREKVKTKIKNLCVHSSLSRGARGDRTGHFWEKRYFSDGFPASDKERALNTLRYIHGNPKAAKMRSGFFYDFSNYGSYERLTDDGLTQWHPAFLQLGNSLEDCAKKYKGFCQRYKPKEKKTPTRSHWGSKLLAGVHLSKQGFSTHPQKSKFRLGNTYQECQVSKRLELTRIVGQFIEANRAPWQVEKDF